jgi:hypothetical protein
MLGNTRQWISGVETVIEYGPDGKNGGVGAAVMFGTVVG